MPSLGHLHRSSQPPLPSAGQPPCAHQTQQFTPPRPCGQAPARRLGSSGGRDVGQCCHSPHARPHGGGSCGAAVVGGAAARDGARGAETGRRACFVDYSSPRAEKGRRCAAGLAMDMAPVTAAGWRGGHSVAQWSAAHAPSCSLPLPCRARWWRPAGTCRLARLAANMRASWAAGDLMLMTGPLSGDEGRALLAFAQSWRQHARVPPRHPAAGWHL